jgi:hypothetical protein
MFSTKSSSSSSSTSSTSSASSSSPFSDVPVTEVNGDLQNMFWSMIPLTSTRLVAHTLRYYKKNGFPLDLNWRNPAQCGMTYLHHACSIGDLTTVEFLLSQPQVNVNKKDRKGRSPLACASHPAVIFKLLRDPRVTLTSVISGRGGRDVELSVLLQACFSGNLLLVKLLIASERKEVEWQERTSRWSLLPYETPRGVAEEKGHHEIAALLESFLVSPTKTRDQIKSEILPLVTSA